MKTNIGYIIASVIAIGAVAAYFFWVNPIIEQKESAEASAEARLDLWNREEARADSLQNVADKMEETADKNANAYWDKVAELDTANMAIAEADSLLQACQAENDKLAALAANKKTTANTTATGTPGKSAIGKPAKGTAIKDDVAKTYTVRESDKSDSTLVAQMPVGFTMKTVPK